jgi:hypothetical protein
VASFPVAEVAVVAVAGLISPLTASLTTMTTSMDKCSSSSSLGLGGKTKWL